MYGLCNKLVCLWLAIYKTQACFEMRQFAVHYESIMFYISGLVFTTLHFLHNVRMGPIS
jgi:hypothetical protein